MKFECKQCGKCCREFSKENGGLVITEWERDKLLRLAAEQGFSFNLKARAFLGDKKSKRNLISFYLFNEPPCPFLKDNKCSIYEDRPLFCRTFPVEFFEKDNSFDVNGACPEALNLFEKEKVTKKEMIKRYYETFGDIFLYNLEFYKTFHGLNKKIIEGLIEKKLIQPCEYNSEYKNKGLLALAIKTGLMNEVLKNSIIASIQNLEAAKKLIDMLKPEN